MIKKALKKLGIIGVFAPLFFTGCIAGGAGSSTFDLGKFLSNPLVMLVIGGIVLYMMLKKK